MPGPQGPEVNETITGESTPVVEKESSPATEIGPKEPPKTSIVNSGSSYTGGVGNATNGPASSSANTTDSLRNSSRRSAKAAADKKATTTSNQAPPVTGFKYYRDLGQK